MIDKNTTNVNDEKVKEIFKEQLTDTIKKHLGKSNSKIGINKLFADKYLKQDNQGCINIDEFLDSEARNMVKEHLKITGKETLEIQIYDPNPRKKVVLKVDKFIEAACHHILDNIREDSNNSFVDSRNMLWDIISQEGYKNLPFFIDENRDLKTSCNNVLNLLEEFKKVRIQIITIYHMKQWQTANFNREGRTYSLELYLTREQFEMIEEIKNKYFSSEPHKSAPYIMLITSFIYSKYNKEHEQDITDILDNHRFDIQRHIESIENEIYAANISILEFWKKIPLDEVSYFVEYLNYFTNHIEEYVSYYSKKDIEKQIVLIIEYCKHVKEFKALYQKADTDFNNNSFDKLMLWSEKTASKNINNLVIK